MHARENETVRAKFSEGNRSEVTIFYSSPERRKNRLLFEAWMASLVVYRFDAKRSVGPRAEFRTRSSRPWVTSQSVDSPSNRNRCDRTQL